MYDFFRRKNNFVNYKYLQYLLLDITMFGTEDRTKLNRKNHWNVYLNVFLYSFPYSAIFLEFHKWNLVFFVSCNYHILFILHIINCSFSANWMSSIERWDDFISDVVVVWWRWSISYWVLVIFLTYPKN